MHTANRDHQNHSHGEAGWESPVSTLAMNPPTKPEESVPRQAFGNGLGGREKTKQQGNQQMLISGEQAPRTILRAAAATGRLTWIQNTWIAGKRRPQQCFIPLGRASRTQRSI